MKIITALFANIFLFIYNLSAQTYNPLWIPDTLSGTTFNLNIIDTFAQLRPGNQTITSGVNNKFWGPTLIFKKGDTVHMNVHNELNDSTTLHWHGIHLPAVMDGGPHQIIPPGTIWQPYWKVTNNAATYWYHPHLHKMTQAQLTAGIGGFIIVRDSQEATLALPRTYGVDDIPVALTSRDYFSDNSFVASNSDYGDYMLTNGTPDAEVSLPKQFVRLRILNAEIMRAYNLGFSDNRTFYVIATDGGLMDTAVAVKRVILATGERIEILVNLGSDTVGSALDLKAYNSGQPDGFPGGEASNSGEFGSLLNNIDFPVLHINVVSATSNAITSLPQKLVNNTFWSAADATLSRTVNVTGQGPASFTLDNTPFNFNFINKKVAVNTIEKWTIINNNQFGHTFHIHDVQFKIISRSTGPIAPYEDGWKDDLYLPVSTSATFVTKFTDYSDSIHPFMYHCHFVSHEDNGMMAQFVVEDHVTGIDNPKAANLDFTTYPNPANNRLYISFSNLEMQAYYITIYNSAGQAMYMLPRPQLRNGIDISALAKGVYFLQLMDDKTKSVITRKFIKS
jgi:blue copper oxidase